MENKRKKMDEERKARQKYVDGMDGPGHRRSTEHQIEERERRRGDVLEQKDKDREAEAIRVMEGAASQRKGVD